MADTMPLDALIVGQAPDALICSDRNGVIIPGLPGRDQCQFQHGDA
ncbi:hypothetical protein [Paraburkholderia ferrariae]|jgi:hypothetical protein|nr:hypothetical protein [Paraburkholderia ferrariae]